VPSAPSESTPDFLVVAQVLGAHGIRGELKCRIVTDFPKRRFRRGAQLLLGAERTPVTVRGARMQGSTVLLQLEEISDRTEAEQFRNAELSVSPEDAVKLPKGEFYWHQVIGLTVIDGTNNETLGTVTDILETGANDVYIVRGDRGEILVPAIKDVVKLIDPTAGRMLIEPLPGLIPDRK
jgi:16S rRNA processing protein RimM